MNPFDYRIKSRGESFFGYIIRVYESGSGPANYCDVRLRDGRVLKFVKYLRAPEDASVVLEEGMRVEVEHNGGLWAFRSV